MTHHRPQTHASATGQFGTWVWNNAELFDSNGSLIAMVCADVICIGPERLLCESVSGRFRFRCRATSGGGEVFTISSHGLTSASLVADCCGNKYRLRRIPGIKTTRMISDTDGDIATVRPGADGTMEVHVKPRVETTPKTDFVFLTWACVLVDGPDQRQLF
ncbi:hypothetical protein ACFSSC_03000 [Corynebacterium mendelii]|uniref:Uncharacterized protein n=1 Tax=Corynebacterium mendelii TaxID=2765362 RepID=A0A939DZQ5_9CORY|nr:hypothetical protein [Corynebacterium mendelii]MBN9644245.1 hypothetical protein [Corynebacterium mendelii]